MQRFLHPHTHTHKHFHVQSGEILDLGSWKSRPGEILYHVHADAQITGCPLYVLFKSTSESLSVLNVERTSASVVRKQNHLHEFVSLQGCMLSPVSYWPWCTSSSVLQVALFKFYENVQDYRKKIPTPQNQSIWEWISLGTRFSFAMTGLKFSQRHLQYCSILRNCNENSWR